MATDRNRSQFLVGDLHAGWVRTGIKLSMDSQPSCGGRLAD